MQEAYKRRTRGIGEARHERLAVRRKKEANGTTNTCGPHSTVHTQDNFASYMKRIHGRNVEAQLWSLDCLTL